jgi:hypothetical protein
MNTRTLMACSVLFLCATVAVSSRQLSFAQSGIADTSPPELKTVSLNLNSTMLNPDEGNQVIRAFVPTGSKSVNCLTTMNEILTEIPLTGIAIFCGERQPAAFGNVPGMLVSVFFPQQPSSDLTLSVTLYQQGAKKYGAPVLCTAEDGC